METKLLALITALVSNGTIFENGYIIDAGANDGRSSMLLRNLFNKTYTILAIEPLRVNVKRIKQISKNDKTIQIIHGALGSKHSLMRYHKNAENTQKYNQIGKLSLYDKFKTGNLSEEATIYTVDNLFKNKTLSFAHWDVEGEEDQVIKGSMHTIFRDRPIFTFETHSIHMKKENNYIMQLIKEINYDCLTIEEICGVWKDCRNLICAIPNTVKKIREIISKQNISYSDP